MRRGGRVGALVILGTLLSAWLVQRVELVLGGPYLAGAIHPELVFAALPLALLAALALAGDRLPRAERAAVYVGLAVGIPLSASGLAHRFLPGLVTGFYGGFANPGSPYYPFLQAFPSWLVPGGPNSEAATAAFEGGAPVPWSAWAVPLAAWGLFFILLFLTGLCLAQLLRPRWLEAERLGFPLLEVPKALLGDASWRSRALWAGIAVPVLLLGVNGLHHYFPAVKPIETGFSLAEVLLDQPWKSLHTFESRFVFDVSPVLVGVAFLMPVEISFGTWFFFLLTRLQLLVAHLAGRLEFRGGFIPGHGSPWLDWPGHFPFLMAQARGGLLCIALYSLWRARQSLRPGPALWGFGAGFAGLWLWTVAAGLPPLAALAAWSLFYLLCVGFIRMRTDAGLPVPGVYLIFGYLVFVVTGTGPEVFDPQAHAIFALMALLGYTAVGLWPALHLESFKLAAEYGAPRRLMIGAMAVGAAVGLAAGAYFALETFYQYGIFTLQEQGGGRSAAMIGRFYNYLYRESGSISAGTDWARIAAHAFGAAVTAALTLLRNLFLRWPLHPMGFVYGTGFGWMVWGSFVVGWLCKWLAVRYGGASTFGRLKPFFVGLILGEIAMRLLWAGVALWRGEMGMGYRM
jgi:hypothetical protein